MHKYATFFLDPSPSKIKISMLLPEAQRKKGPGGALGAPNKKQNGASKEKNACSALADGSQD